MIDGPNRPGSLSRILELVRTSGSARTKEASRNPAGPQRQESTAGASRDVAVLKARLRRQVEGVDTDDSAAVSTARKSVLREIFAWEFGDAIRNHPEFGMMVDAVESAMSADEKVRDRFAALIRDLKG